MSKSRSLTTWTSPPTLHGVNMPGTVVGDQEPLLKQQPTIQLNLMHITWTIIQASFRKPTKSTTARRLIFPATSTNGNITKSPTCCPVSLAALAEMPRLVNVIVVEVTKFSLHALTSRAWDDLLRPLFRRWIFLIILIFFDLSSM